jgi:hypothetical protein
MTPSDNPFRCNMICRPAMSALLATLSALEAKTKAAALAAAEMPTPKDRSVCKPRLA